ncbi:MAG: hypothetical protein ACXW1U_19580 [Methylobacter sp.]
MKIKLLASSLLMAGTLMASGTASAIPFYSGTVASWITDGPIVDGDGDSVWTFNQTSGDLIGREGDIDVVLSEVEVAGDDLYTVSFDFQRFNGGDGYSGALGDLGYTAASLVTDERFASARLDTDVAAGVGELVTKDIHDVNNIVPFLTLTSLNGAPDPSAGHTHFTPREAIFVNDTLNANGSFITHVDNQFDLTGVPEIDATSATSALTLLFGALGLLSNRRRPRADLMA